MSYFNENKTYILYGGDSNSDQYFIYEGEKLLDHKFKLYLKGYKIAENLYANIRKTILYGPNSAGKQRLWKQ